MQKRTGYTDNSSQNMDLRGGRLNTIRVFVTLRLILFRVIIMEHYEVAENTLRLSAVLGTHMPIFEDISYNY